MAIGSLALIGPAPVAAYAATCDYNATTHKVTVALTGEGISLLFRDPAGHIFFGNSWCDAAATVTNTDSILVTGDAASQGIIVELFNNSFKPGFTNEAGKSDEIEFTINLGGGTADEITILGTDGPNKIDLGQNNTQFGIIRRVNLNAGESTGVDSDVALVSVESVTVLGYGGNDVIRARGKAGTGPDAFSLPLEIHGGPGDDIIKGGEASDWLYGEPGRDKIWGYGAPDDVNMNDGEAGDVGYGGAGNDSASYEIGDTWTD